MTSINDHFKHESLEDSESIVKYLEALEEGFQKGALQFSSDGQQLILKPHGLINMEVDARRKGDDIRLSIKLRWSESTAPKKPRSHPLRIQPLTQD